MSGANNTLHWRYLHDEPTLEPLFAKWFQQHMANLDLRHIHFIRLTSPKETALFLEQLRRQIQPV